MQHHTQSHGSNVQTAQIINQKIKGISNHTVFTHSKILKYFCEKCGEGFSF